MTKASAEVKPFGVTYHVLQMVVRSIDALATVLTGQGNYFSVGGSTANDAANISDADRLIRELREKPRQE